MGQYRQIREFKGLSVPTTGLEVYILGDTFLDTDAAANECGMYKFNGDKFVPVNRTGSIELSGVAVYNLKGLCVNSFFITLNQDSAINIPTDLETGDVGTIYINQGLLGGYLMDWGPGYVFPDALPILTVGAFSQSVFDYEVLLDGTLLMAYVTSLEQAVSTPLKQMVTWDTQTQDTAATFDADMNYSNDGGVSYSILTAGSNVVLGTGIGPYILGSNDIVTKLNFDGNPSGFNGEMNVFADTLTTTVTMFKDMKNLKELNVDNLDMSNVTNATSMFQHCDALTELDVTGFDTSNVTTMSNMFVYCINVKSLDISGFDTSKVKSFTGMFRECRELESLELSNIDTSKNTNFSSMFASCRKLTEIDVSGFDTSLGTTFAGMFGVCLKLTSLDVSGFNTAIATSLSGMFDTCPVLPYLDVSNFVTGTVTRMDGMFKDCHKLDNLDVSGFDTSSVTTLSQMFLKCGWLKVIDVSTWDTGNVVNLGSTFNACAGIEILDIAGWNVSKVTITSGAFRSCVLVDVIDVTLWDTSKVTNMLYMFGGCRSLVSLTHIHNLDITAITNPSASSMNEFLTNTPQLTPADLDGLLTAYGTQTAAGGGAGTTPGLKRLEISSTENHTIAGQAGYDLLRGEGWVIREY